MAPSWSKKPHETNGIVIATTRAILNKIRPVCMVVSLMSLSDFRSQAEPSVRTCGHTRALHFSLDGGPPAACAIQNEPL